MNSMNAKRMALLGSPQMRQSMTVPQPAKKVARLSSVTCRTATRQQDAGSSTSAVCQHDMGWCSRWAPWLVLAPQACAGHAGARVRACVHGCMCTCQSACSSARCTQHHDWRSHAHTHRVRAHRLLGALHGCARVRQGAGQHRPCHCDASLSLSHISVSLSHPSFLPRSLSLFSVSLPPSPPPPSLSPPPQDTHTHLLVDVADVHGAPDVVLKAALHLLAATAALHLLLLLLAAWGPHASGAGPSWPTWPTTHPAAWSARWPPSAIHHPHGRRAHGSALLSSGALLVLLLRRQGWPTQPWRAAWVAVTCRRSVACRRHALLLLLVVEAGLLHHLLLSWRSQHHVVHALGERKGVCLWIATAVGGPGHVLVRGQVVLRWLGDSAVGQDAVCCGVGHTTTVTGLLGRVVSELGPAHVGATPSAPLLLLLLSHFPAAAAGSRLPPESGSQMQVWRWMV